MIGCQGQRTPQELTIRSALRPGLNSRRGGVLISRECGDDKENLRPGINRLNPSQNTSMSSYNHKTQAQRDILDSYRSARAVHYLQKADIFKLVGSTSRSGSATGRKSSLGSASVSTNKKAYETESSALHRSFSLHSAVPPDHFRTQVPTLQDKIRRKLSNAGLERVEWTHSTTGSQQSKSPYTSNDLFFGTECSEDNMYKVMNSYYDESPKKEEVLLPPKMGESMVTIKEVEEKDEAAGYSSRKSGDIQASFKNLLDRYCKDVSAPNLVPATETKQPPQDREDSPRDEKVHKLEVQLKKLLSTIENNPTRRKFSRGAGWEPFQRLDSISDPEVLKKNIRDMEIEKREREAELIQMNMQLQDLGRIAHDLLRSAKSSTARKGWAV